MNIDTQKSTRVDEIASGIYRISTPVPPKVIPGGFTFNQFLIVDDLPLLYHTGPHKMFIPTREAIASVIPPGVFSGVIEITRGQTNRGNDRN